jgi:nucleoside-diphosphate-sugar epimerase
MQERDFTYVEDVARGILAAVNSDWNYEIINLGSDQPYSINTVIEFIEKKLEKKANRQYFDPDPADVPFTHASTDKAYQLLGWLASTNLHDGIEKTCLWYKNNRDWLSTLDLQIEKNSK